MRTGRLFLVAAALLCYGCAGRGLLPGPEAREASAFFGNAEARFSFPVSASFSGVVENGDEAFPFIAGVCAASHDNESVGLYDPMGRVVMMLSSNGAVVSLEAGPVAGPLARLGGKKAPAGELSIGRILWGAPGYPVGRGEYRSSGDGGWQFSDGRQTLRTDATRRCIAGAEYSIAGSAVAVSYPGCEPDSAPSVVMLDVFGAKVELRRDTE